jgi:23S rRNA pseudouridine1911/1915/1917 synthase
MPRSKEPRAFEENGRQSPDPAESPSDTGLTFRLTYRGDVRERLDLFIFHSLSEFSRSQVRRLIISGLALLNGQQAKAGSLLRPGDLVEITIPPSPPPRIKPESIPLEILYDDPHLLAINKPAGMVVHPGPGHTSKTLVHALLALCPALDTVGGPQRAGLVHRLDKDTSGVMVVAKTEQAHRHLTTQFKERQVEKSYLTLVHGIVQGVSGIINLPLGRHPRDRKRISTRTRTPRSAVTHWQILKRLPYCTLLRVKPETGRTHQIRVHLAAVHHPVVGDPLYRGGTRLRQIPKEDTRSILLSAPRQFLHAETLSIDHPTLGHRCTFTAPLPTDLMEILGFFGIDHNEKFDTPDAITL